MVLVDGRGGQAERKGKERREVNINISPPGTSPTALAAHKRAAARFGKRLFGRSLRCGFSLAGLLLVETPLVLEVEPGDVPEHVVANPVKAGSKGGRGTRGAFKTARADTGADCRGSTPSRPFGQI